MHKATNAQFSYKVHSPSCPREKGAVRQEPKRAGIHRGLLTPQLIPWCGAWPPPRPDHPAHPQVIPRIPQDRTSPGCRDRHKTTAGQCARARRNHSEGKTSDGSPAPAGAGKVYMQIPTAPTLLKRQLASAAAGHKHCLVLLLPQIPSRLTSN